MPINPVHHRTFSHLSAVASCPPPGPAAAGLLLALSVVLLPTAAAAQTSFPPPKPGTPTATAGVESAALSWSSNGDGGTVITKWEYQKSGNDGNWENMWHAIPNSGPDTTSYTVTGLTAGHKHKFKVRAVNSVGNGAASDESNEVTVLAATAPLAPGKPTATRGNGQVALSWSSNGDGGAAITRWEYVKNEDGGSFETNWTQMSGSGASTTSYTVTDLTNGTAYQFKVRAVNGVGDGAESPASDAVTPATTPPAPGKPTATAGDASVTLSWSSNGNGGSAITSWEYDQNEGGGGFNGNWTAIPSSGASTTSYTVGSLTNGTAYQFKVRAVNDIGNGAESPASDAATPSVAPDKPAAPSVTSEDSAIRYSWTAPDDNGMDVTGYDVEYRAKGDAGWTSKGSVGANTTSGYLDGLTNGTTYQVRVRAANKFRKGPWSDPGEGLPNGIPGTPAAPTVTGGSASGELKVSWDAPSDGGSAITTYYVHYSECSSGCHWIAAHDDVAGNVTTTTFTGLQNGKRYWVRVKAENANGSGGWSETGSGAPSAPPPPPDKKTGSVASITETSANLTIANHSGAWSYQQMSSQQASLQQKSLASQLSSCVNMPAGTYSTSLTGLQSGTTYTYDVFSAADCPSAASIGTLQFTTDETNSSPPDNGNDDQTGGGQTGDDGGGGDTGGGDTGGGGGGDDPEPVPAIPGLGAALLAGLLALAGIVRRRAAG